MSESDFRNGRPRKYYVTNRGSDSDDGSDDDRPAVNEFNAYQYPSAYHPKQPFAEHQYDHQRPMVKTDLAPSYPQHPARPPPSSSPSSASSQSQPAEEATQVPQTARGYHPQPLPSPPTTAAKSIQSLHDILQSNDRPPQDTLQMRGPYPSHIRPAPAWGNGSGPRSIPDPGSARRPKTSPSVATPDSAASSSSFPQTEAIKICVTAEGAPDSMSLVDVSGLRDGSYIRRGILYKTHPNSDVHHTLSVYRTLVGNSTFGEPLSDDQLLDIVRSEGDSRGTLRFFVSQFQSDQQPSASLPRSEASAVPPLRPKRRSRSRQNSVSSNISEQPFELGYDADRDDDDSRKSSARQTTQPHLNGTSGSPPSPIPRRRQVTGPIPPHPAGPPPPAPISQSLPPSQLQHQAYPPPPLPSSMSYYAPHVQTPYGGGYHHPSSPISQSASSKPPTPPSYFDRQQPSSARTFVDRYGHVLPTPGPPPPLSPRRTDFSPDEPTSAISAISNPLSHGRSNSDASGEHEQASLSPEQMYDGFSRQYSRQGMPIRHRNESPRDTIFPSRPRKAIVGENDQWASSNGSDSNLTPQETLRPSHSRLASSRHRSQLFPSKQSGASQPLATGAGFPRPYTGSRQIALEKSLLNRSKPPESHGPKPKTVSEVKSLVKGKSMDNLRQNLPIASSKNRPALPQVPTRPSAPYTPSSPYGIPRSYEPTTTPRTARALPVQGAFHPQSPETMRSRPQTKVSPHLGPPSMSSPSHSRDPYTRPRSAADNASPTQQRPSPSFGSHLPNNDYFRPPGPISPNRTFGIAGPRPPHQQSNHSDRSSDVPSGPETSNSTPPPRTPISPVGSRPSPKEIPLVVEVSSPGSDSNGGTFMDDSDMTIRDDDKAGIQAMLKNLNMNAMLSQQHLSDLPKPVDDTSDGEDYGSGGTWVSHGDGGTWIVAPKRPPSIRPELSKLDTNLPSDNEEHGTLRRPPAPPPQARVDSQQTLQAHRPAPQPPHRPNTAAQNRFSGFAEDPDDWAPRPLPEDVLERLDEFFPEQDLDKPVIEANSGGNSPVTVEPNAPFPVSHATSHPPPVQPMNPRRHKKSIRIVAEEQKKRMHNRVSREDTVYANNALLRKRNTKLWDYKVEEVDTMHMKSSSIPESPSSASSPSAPTFKWVRGELIGKGTYGRVYLALNATTGEMIAVKQVELPQTPSDRNDSRQNTVVQALKLESETLKDLDHPHIVQYLGFEETPANLSIFLEYVPGGSIGSWLHKHGSFREDVTISFTGQILAGLEYLHSKGIIHRDLKADNILVEMNGTCKISDFGISKRTDELQGAFTALQGTVFWMAPEVINTQGKGYNFKIDIWSVGCVVLEMWGGRRPWTGQEMVAVMFKLYEAKLPPPVPDDVHLSPLADDLRQKCFAINPDERPSAAELRRHPYLELPSNWIFPGFSRS